MYGERPCQRLQVELEGGLVEQASHPHSPIPGGVIDKDEQIDIGLLRGRLTAGSRAEEPDRVELLLQILLELLDEQLSQCPLIGQQG